MKNSIQHDAVAWLSQMGVSGEKVFIPLAQNSSFDLALPRVIHKGIGSSAPLANYRYKSPNVTFNLEILASNSWTMGADYFSRIDMAYENYTSGTLLNESLSGKYSALYVPPDEQREVCTLYSLYNEGFSTSGEISNLSDYSGYYCKFEDCVLKNMDLSMDAGKIISTKLSFAAQDAGLIRGTIPYVSGINGFYEAACAKDMTIILSSSGELSGEFFSGNFSSAQISLPIQYKTVEGFGSNKPYSRKMIFPMVGSLKVDGLPPSFSTLANKWLETEDSMVSCSILLRTVGFGSQTHAPEDYLLIKIPKLYLNSKNIQSSVNSRTSQSFEFSFFENGSLGETSGSEGLFFVRKIPDTVYNFRV